MDRFKAASEYVDAVLDLPPTFKDPNLQKFSNCIPDIVTEEEMQMKLDRVKETRENYEKK